MIANRRVGYPAAMSAEHLSVLVQRWGRTAGLNSFPYDGHIRARATPQFWLSYPFPGRLRANQATRCRVCGRRRAAMTAVRVGDGDRWRSLDAGTLKVFIEADAPWARHGAGHTRAFDHQVAWLTTRTSKTAVMNAMRMTWRTVGAIAGRSSPTPERSIRSTG